jgi:hypothetical protein
LVDDITHNKLKNEVKALELQVYKLQNEVDELQSGASLGRIMAIVSAVIIMFLLLLLYEIFQGGGFFCLLISAIIIIVIIGYILILNRTMY